MDEGTRASWIRDVHSSKLVSLSLDLNRKEENCIRHFLSTKHMHGIAPNLEYN